MRPHLPRPLLPPPLRLSLSRARPQGIDLDRINLHQWTRFTKDFRLADQGSAHCKRADLDRLFVLCNKLHDDSEHPATKLTASRKHLSRPQFYAALIRLAILKYVRPRLVPDVSTALERLITRDIEPRQYEASHLIRRQALRRAMLEDDERDARTATATGRRGISVETSAEGEGAGAGGGAGGGASGFGDGLSLGGSVGMLSLDQTLGGVDHGFEPPDEPGAAEGGSGFGDSTPASPTIDDDNDDDDEAEDDEAAASADMDGSGAPDAAMAPAAMATAGSDASRLASAAATTELGSSSSQLLKAPRVTVFIEPNEFRRRHCYTEACTEALAAHKESLRNLFDALSASIGERGLEKKLLSLPEWLGFLRTCGLVGADLSDTDAVHCFLWSRMAVVDTSTFRGVTRANNLPFEGFLEALCRVAALKGWPQAWEMSTLGFEDCAQFVEYLNAMDPDRWPAMRHERRIAWGDEPVTPVAEAVRHMLSLIRAAVLTPPRTTGTANARARGGPSATSSSSEQRGATDGGSGAGAGAARPRGASDSTEQQRLEASRRVITRKEAMEWCHELVGERHPDLIFEVKTGYDKASRAGERQKPKTASGGDSRDALAMLAPVRAPGRQLGM